MCQEGTRMMVTPLLTACPGPPKGIVNITQIELEEESPLFPNYYDDSYDVV